ncbi:TetR/AcrR family transcriptional regulator [Kribbella sp. NPDC051936]|uniref:TetR/AcrR family transcriptional regulator n=1 Tax=Kribbella sp. NPDC051936 TaxID=3154946 RepID=UPI00343AE658
MNASRLPAASARAPRADARRSITAILDAGAECLAADPEATVAVIARAAGVARATLYGHFPARADLVDAVFERVTTQAGETLETVDVSGDPEQALRELVASSWRIVHRFRAVLAVAERELPPGRVRKHHARHLDRLTELLTRGQETGAFRTDLAVEWLVTACFTLMHAAAAEVVAGRLDDDHAETAVVESILSVCTPSAR